MWINCSSNRLENDLNFHWMAREPEHSIEELKSLINKLEDTGYKSVLLLFGTKMSDYWIKAARTLNTSHKIKYMFAMRPYAVSPEYCYMMSKSMNQIDPNRVMLNLVSGEFYPEEVEPTAFDGTDMQIDEKEKRRLYTRKFVKKFLEISAHDPNRPTILISGAAPTAVRTAKDYGDYSLFMYADFMHDQKTFSGMKRKMISFSLLIRDTQEEANEAIRDLSDIDKMNTIAGTKESFIDMIKYLQECGIDDILIDRTHCETNVDYIHDIIKELIDANI